MFNNIFFTDLITHIESLRRAHVVVTPICNTFIWQSPESCDPGLCNMEKQICLFLGDFGTACVGEVGYGSGNVDCRECADDHTEDHCECEAADSITTESMMS